MADKYIKIDIEFYEELVRAFAEHQRLTDKIEELLNKAELEDEQ